MKKLLCILFLLVGVVLVALGISERNLLFVFAGVICLAASKAA